MKTKIYREKEFLGNWLRKADDTGNIYQGTDPVIRGIWKKGIMFGSPASPPEIPDGKHTARDGVVDPVELVKPRDKAWVIAFISWARDHGYTLKVVK